MLFEEVPESFLYVVLFDSKDEDFVKIAVNSTNDESALQEAVAFIQKEGGKLAKRYILDKGENTELVDASKFGGEKCYINADYRVYRFKI